MGITFSKKLTAKMEMAYTSARQDSTLCPKEEVQFAYSEVQNCNSELQLKNANEKSLLTCMTTAAKLGVSLNPLHEQATLKPVLMLGRIEVTLNLSLKGMIDAFRKNGLYKLHAFNIASVDEVVSWGGDVMGSMLPTSINDISLCNLTGAVCVVKHPNGDLLPTTITQAEISDLASKSHMAHKDVDYEFILKHVFKRALKNIPTSNGSEIDILQQTVRMFDISLFNKNR